MIVDRRQLMTGSMAALGMAALPVPPVPVAGKAVDLKVEVRAFGQVVRRLLPLNWEFNELPGLPDDVRGVAWEHYWEPINPKGGAKGNPNPFAIEITPWIKKQIVFHAENDKQGVCIMEQSVATYMEVWNLDGDGNRVGHGTGHKQGGEYHPFAYFDARARLLRRTPNGKFTLPVRGGHHAVASGHAASFGNRQNRQTLGGENERT